MRTQVKDVMTAAVVSVSGEARFKDIAESLIEHAISAVPVIDDDRQVIGVVSEADLLAKEEFREQYYREGYQPPLRARLRHRMSADGPTARRKAAGDTAFELMTSPAHTITAHAGVTEAARLMDEHGVKRLAVVDRDGRLTGIVSRRDLLKVFVREDESIAREIREEILDRAMWVETAGVHVTVDRGVVTLSGRIDRRSEAQIAVRMTRRVNGVIDVVDQLLWTENDTVAWEDR
ncbi:CBS domain-containing protein [Spongiactinospora sp. TRM90649]|uniref:CBS domain-containing protein n=1 Tax=Spongiactinospora sp. TRM90649 TaxID=3031114 RepID=UPI0023F87193|nr:CBS domain-containing protein [Spongiactinospora sp. TRM90649]MDF5754351.1 CBS domain-containing protein [Spongiactinospora sp. TRM90649]